MTELFLNILTWCFKKVQIPEKFKQIQEELPDSIIVTQSKSLVLRAFLRSIAQRCGWKGEHNLLSPDEKNNKDFLNWVSFNQFIRWKQIKTEEQKSKTFVTLSIFNLRGPVKSLPKHRLDFIDVIFLFLGDKVNSFILGTPINSEAKESLSKLRLERKLKVEFYKNQKIVRGTPFEEIETQCRTVLSGSNYQRELEILSRRQGISKTALNKKARKIFFEIAANPKTLIFRIAAFLCRPFLKQMFSQIITKGIENIPPTVRENATVIVPMHRSHFDYIIMSSEIYNSRLNPPLTAAGINLSFWPFGFFIRSLGGFFVKRNSTGDRLYNIVFKRYVLYLIKRGHLQKFYIEGGRSRTGKMRTPKLGLLSMFVEAYLSGSRKDIAFIPVSLTYENIVEDSAYGKENTGSEKVKESWKAIFAARNLFRKRYGEVVLRFAKPIKISAIINKEDIKHPKEIRQQTKQLAYTLSEEIRAASDISFTSLAFTSLMASPNYGMTIEHLTKSIKNLCRHVEVMKKIDSRIGDFTPSLKKFLSGNEDLILDLPRTGIANLSQYAGESVISIHGNSRFTADFYRNVSTHLFLPSALLATSELIHGKITNSDIDLFRKAFEKEYLLPSTETFRTYIQKAERYLEEEGIINSEKQFFSKSAGIFNPALILGSLQSVLYVYETLQARTKYEENWKMKDIVQELHDDFKSSVYLGKFQRTEAAAKSSIESSISTLRDLGVLLIKDELDDKTIGFVNMDSKELVFIKKANDKILEYLKNTVVDNA